MLAGKGFLYGGAEFGQRETVRARRHVGEAGIQQVIDFGLEGHDAAGDAEDEDEDARDQGEVEVDVEEKSTQAIRSYLPGR